jgi:methionyl-tRNA formyltransferase
MNIVFMGTPEFAAYSLEKLIDSKYNVIRVVTQPDRPKGRGLKVISSPVKDTAVENNIPCFQPERPNDSEFVSTLRSLKTDAIVVVAYGHIISKDILNIPPYGCINIHSSLLPKYRGAAPVNWAIIKGEKTTGITTMLMDEHMDTGDILLQKETPLLNHYTAKDLEVKLSPLGAELLVETLEGLENGSIKPTPQDHAKATYAPKLKKEDGLIDWKKSSQEIHNLVRGVNPWPGAYTYMEDKLLKIWLTEIEDKRHLGSDGEITEATKNKVVVNTGDGSLSLLEVQLEGGKRLTIKDFLQGHPLKTRTVFRTKRD